MRLEGNKTAVSGRPVTLSCWYSLPERVQQVLWRKTAEQGDTTVVAFYTKHGHHSVTEAFRNQVSLSQTLDDTQLTIRSVRTEDEACYTCEYHTFPGGSRSATACLSVFGESFSCNVYLIFKLLIIGFAVKCCHTSHRTKSDDQDTFLFHCCSYLMELMNKLVVRS